jgi:hypothetical protein
VRPLPHAALHKFVRTEGWTQKVARGRTGDHFRYFLALADGRILYIRVSHGSGAINDPALITVILRDQLDVTDAAFCACAEDGTLPPRPTPEGQVEPGERLDYTLVRNLTNKVGLTEQQVSSLTREQALRRWAEYLEGGGG